MYEKKQLLASKEVTSRTAKKFGFDFPRWIFDKQLIHVQV